MNSQQQQLVRFKLELQKAMDTAEEFLIWREYAKSFPCLQLSPSE